jgi:hypothetical protein
MSASEASGQAEGCRHGSARVQVDIGSPSPERVTLQEQLASPAERHSYKFRAVGPSAAFAYVGDGWYDLDLVMYGRGRCVAAWQVNPSAYNMERRVPQFVRPDEQTVPSIRGTTN